MISPRSTGPSIGSWREVRLVVGARRLASIRAQRGSTGSSAAQRARELGQRGSDREVGLVHAAELVRIGMDVDERLPRPRRLEQRVAPRRNLAEPAADRERRGRRRASRRRARSSIATPSTPT